MEITNESQVDCSTGFGWEANSQETPVVESPDFASTLLSTNKSSRGPDKKPSSTLQDPMFLEVMNLSESSGLVKPNETLGDVSRVQVHHANLARSIQSWDQPLTTYDRSDSSNNLETNSQFNLADGDSESISQVYYDNGHVLVSHGNWQHHRELLRIIRNIWLLSIPIPPTKGLYSAFYSPSYANVQGDNSPSHGKCIKIGYNVRIFFKSYRLMPYDKPRRIPYKLHGTLSQLKGFLSAEKKQERHTVAWRKVAAILSSSQYREPISPGFEKTAAAFFNGEAVLEPEHYELDEIVENVPGNTKGFDAPQTTSKPGSTETDALLGQNSNSAKKYQIIERGGDWAKVLNTLDETEILKSGIFFNFIRDLIMNDELKTAAWRRTTLYGLKVFPQIKIVDGAEKILDRIQNWELGEIPFEVTEWADMATADTCTGANNHKSATTSCPAPRHAENDGNEQRINATLEKSNQRNAVENKTAPINTDTDISTTENLDPITKPKHATKVDRLDEEPAELQVSARKKDGKKCKDIKPNPRRIEQNERNSTEEAADLDTSLALNSENGDPNSKSDTEAGSQINPAIESEASTETRLSDRPNDDAGWNVVQAKEKRKPTFVTSRSVSNPAPTQRPMPDSANKHKRTPAQKPHFNVSRSIQTRNQIRNPLYQNQQQRETSQLQVSNQGRTQRRGGPSQPQSSSQVQFQQKEQTSQPQNSSQAENKQREKSSITPFQIFRDREAVKSSMSAKTALKQVQTERVYNPADYPVIPAVARQLNTPFRLPSAVSPPKLVHRALEFFTNSHLEENNPNRNPNKGTIQDLAGGAGDGDQKSISILGTQDEVEVNSDDIKVSELSSSSVNSVSAACADLEPVEDFSIIEDFKNGNSDFAGVDNLVSRPKENRQIIERPSNEKVNIQEDSNQASQDNNLDSGSSIVEESAHATLNTTTGTADGNETGDLPPATPLDNSIHSNGASESEGPSRQNDTTEVSISQLLVLDTGRAIDAEPMTSGSGDVVDLAKTRATRKIHTSISGYQGRRNSAHIPESQNRGSPNASPSSCPSSRFHAQHEHTNFTSSMIPLDGNQYFNDDVCGNGYQSSRTGREYIPSGFYPRGNSQHFDCNVSSQRPDYYGLGFNQNLYPPIYKEHGHPAFNVGVGSDMNGLVGTKWTSSQSQIGSRSCNPTSVTRAPYGGRSRDYDLASQNLFAHLIWCTYCSQPILQRDESPLVLCPGCGPMCNIHYCSVACLLVDSLGHSISCMQKPASQSLIPQAPPIPSVIHELDPVYPLDGFLETPERLRQKLFSIYCSSGPFPKLYKAWSKKSDNQLNTPGFDENESMKNTGDYTIFRSNVTGAPSRDNPNADVLFSIKLDKYNPMRQALIRALNACFLCLVPRIVKFLYHLILQVILNAELAPAVLAEFHVQFKAEFEFDATIDADPQYNFEFQREWDIVKNPLSRLEGSHPVLRRWLVKP